MQYIEEQISAARDPTGLGAGDLGTSTLLCGLTARWTYLSAQTYPVCVEEQWIL
jgi:hypothetical protein